MESGLTYEEIVEILLRQEELLELYRRAYKQQLHGKSISTMEHDVKSQNNG